MRLLADGVQSVQSISFFLDRSSAPVVLKANLTAVKQDSALIHRVLLVNRFAGLVVCAEPGFYSGLKRGYE